MRFMVDASTGRRVAQFLRTLGHDALSADEATPAAGGGGFGGHHMYLWYRLASAQCS